MLFRSGADLDTVSAGRLLACDTALAAVLTCPNPAFPPCDMAARLALESAWPDKPFNAESAAVVLLLAITSPMLSSFRIHLFHAPDSLPPSERSMYWTTLCIYCAPLKLALTSEPSEVFCFCATPAPACYCKLKLLLNARDTPRKTFPDFANSCHTQAGVRGCLNARDGKPQVPRQPRLPIARQT